MTRAAKILYDRCGDDAFTVHQAEEIAAEVKEAWRAEIEHETIHDAVMQAQKQGFCPTCGSDWR